MLRTMGMFGRMRRYIQSLSQPELDALWERANRQGCARISALCGDEWHDREQDRADHQPSRDAYDATDDLYLYDRNNPFSPWAY